MEILLLQIFIPLIAALIILLSGKSIAKSLSGIFSLVPLLITIYLYVNFIPDASTQFLVDIPWIPQFGIHFKAGVDGISLLLLILTNLLISIIILSSFKHDIKNLNAFYALIFFMQSGLLLVFTALDGFLFYIGWEIALIPVYFICALWGAENRIKVNLKFFIYTIAGSLFMLLAIVYLHLQTPGNSYDLLEFYKLDLDNVTQSWIFWAFFLAFAIKMPVFPFHTWQPDTYTEAPTAGTMLLSGIMLKMGIYGVIRWLIPVAPIGFNYWGETALILSVVGIIYASIIAFTQNDIKRLIAYSSIAHVGLISAGIFVWNLQGLQGAMIQMLNHGINVVGMFFIADILIRRMNTRDMNQMGGIAKPTPLLACTFLVVLLGTVALPLTNGFVGEFLLLIGIYNHGIWLAIASGLTIIFGAVYMLSMYQKVMLGPVHSSTAVINDLDGTEKAVLFVISILVIFIGIYPQPILNISEAAVVNLLEQVNQKILVK
ncbi:MAG: NADH-quinone oxidoreductase subunit M [Bacteroidetes bacterium]|nr:NADH-quinone oxidoreductase subunit M [Bacteroidota bacterium]